MIRLINTLKKKSIILALATTVGGIVTAICLTTLKTENNASKINKEDPLPIKIEELPQPQSITKLLEENNLKLLNKDDLRDAEKWLQNWNKFKEKFAQKEPGWAWKFTNWSNLKDSTNVPKKFKAKCLSNSKRKINSIKQQLYKDIVTYCTRGDA